MEAKTAFSAREVVCHKGGLTGRGVGGRDDGEAPFEGHEPPSERADVSPIDRSAQVPKNEQKKKKKDGFPPYVSGRAF